MESKFLGGWCGLGGAGCSGIINACTFVGKINQLPVSYNGNTILIGMKSYIENVSRSSSEGNPLTIPASLKSVKNRFLTVGGENSKTKMKLIGNKLVDDIASSYADELYNYSISAGYTGIDFDCEGVLTLSMASQLVNKIKTNPKFALKQITFQVTLMASIRGSEHGYYGAGDNTVAFYDNLNNFDSIALMTYGNSMVGSGWNLNSTASIGSTIQESIIKNNGATWSYICRWLKDPKIDKSKIVLAMTPAGCTNNMVKLYIDTINQFGLKGLLFWRICEASKYITAAKTSFLSSNQADGKLKDVDVPPILESSSIKEESSSVKNTSLPEESTTL